MLTPIHDTEVHTHTTPTASGDATKVNLNELCGLAADSRLSRCLRSRSTEGRSYVTVEPNLVR